MTIKILENLLINKEEWELAPFKFGAHELNFVSGGDTPTPPVPVGNADLGKIKISATTVTDEKYHLANGDVLTNTNYSDFITRIAELYNEDPTADCFASTIDVNNYQLIGSPVDTDGVITGFTSNNYAIISENFAPSTSTWETVIKFKTSDVSLGYATILEGQVSGTRYLDIMLSSSKLFVSMAPNDSSSWIVDTGGTTTLSNDTWYWLKYEYTGTQYNLYLSTTGEFNGEETAEFSVSQSRVCRQNMALRFGSGFTPMTGGSIDMNNCYIKIDSHIWWEGTTRINDPEQVWQYEVSKYNVCGKYVYDAENETVRLPLYSNKLATSQTYQVIGSLTNNNGVYSGFTENDYILLPTMMPANNKWEMVFSFTTADDVEDQQVAGAVENYTIVPIHMGGAGGWLSYISTNGTSWDIDTGYIYYFSPNTSYTFKIEFTGTQYKWSHYNGGWSTDYTRNSTTPIPQGFQLRLGRGFKGTINLNECYININDTTWWNGNAREYTDTHYYIKVKE